MKYLISKFECVLKGQTEYHIYKNVPYAIDETNCDYVVFGANGEIPFVFNPTKNSKNCLLVQNGADDIYVLFPTIYSPTNFVKIKHQNKDVFICVSNELSISVGDEQILSMTVENLKYSHYETVQDYCIIYFEGERDFVVILKNLEIKIATYYDECNIENNEYYFMCKLNDFNNHGRVIHLNSSAFEDYFVYLKDAKVDFKDEFVACAFLDCVKNQNYRSANEMLADGIKLENSSELKMFFEEFDDYITFKDNYILTNKNALAGIYKFELNQNKIENIISL